jgi:hypothetical protein
METEEKILAIDRQTKDTQASFRKSILVKWARGAVKCDEKL